jgi:glutamine amidotransferase
MSGYADIKGLGIIPGSCHKISNSVSNRVPHVGWNEVVANSANLHFKALSENKDFYFVHSYHVEPSNELSILTSTNLERGQIASSVLQQNVLGFQFHPEKSGVIGSKLLGEVISWARNET